MGVYIIVYGRVCEGVGIWMRYIEIREGRVWVERFKLKLMRPTKSIEIQEFTTGVLIKKAEL